MKCMYEYSDRSGIHILSYSEGKPQTIRYFPKC